MNTEMVRHKNQILIDFWIFVPQRRPAPRTISNATSELTVAALHFHPAPTPWGRDTSKI
jgi:hypothetical protein